MFPSALPVWRVKFVSLQHGSRLTVMNQHKIMQSFTVVGKRCMQDIDQNLQMPFYETVLFQSDLTDSINEHHILFFIFINMNLIQV